MILSNEQRDWLMLALAPGVGTVRFIRLLARFGEPGRVLRATVEELAEVVGPKLAERIHAHADAVDMDIQENRMDALDVRLITMDDPAYPPQLAEIYDPPLLLFARGELLEEDQQAVAIVGTRRASKRGCEMAHNLAAELAGRGVTVVSGLAEGIDAAAHQGAIEGGGRTIAVLASGHDQVFPVCNADLLDRVIRQGCALTQFPMGARAVKGVFPQRNRVLSGLCLGVVVVEAPPGSGALITARFAAEQGREVFAVPGPAGYANSRGPHELIRDGAKLVESVDDILMELKVSPAVRQSAATRTPATGTEAQPPAKQETLDFRTPPASHSPAPAPAHKPTPPARTSAPPLSDDEKYIMEVLHREGSFVDEIALACRLPISNTLAALTMLELKGLVRQMSGKRFAIK